MLFYLNINNINNSMKKKIALITGISGQDGAYLAEFLLDKNYTVVGSERRSARYDMWRLKRLGIERKIIIEELELTEPFEISRLIKKYKFDEIYNLGAQSFVKSSFSSPLYTCNTNGLSVLRILETIREFSPKTKFYQASSSEMFGEILTKNKMNELLLTQEVLMQYQKFLDILLLKIIENRITYLQFQEFYLIMSHLLEVRNL